MIFAKWSLKGQIKDIFRYFIYIFRVKLRIFYERTVGTVNETSVNEPNHAYVVDDACTNDPTTSSPEPSQWMAVVSKNTKRKSRAAIVSAERIAAHAHNCLRI